MYYQSIAVKYAIKKRQIQWGFHAQRPEERQQFGCLWAVAFATTNDTNTTTECSIKYHMCNSYLARHPRHINKHIQWSLYGRPSGGNYVGINNGNLFCRFILPISHTDHAHWLPWISQPQIETTQHSKCSKLYYWTHDFSSDQTRNSGSASYLDIYYESWQQTKTYNWVCSGYQISFIRG